MMPLLVEDTQRSSIALLEDEVPTNETNTYRYTYPSSHQGTRDGSQLDVVHNLSRSIDMTKTLMLIVLMAAGIYFTTSTYCTASEDYHMWISFGIYALQILLLLHYDYLVNRRHLISNEISEQSKSIVEALFPSVVRDRLLYESRTRSRRGSEASLSHQQDDVVDVETGLYIENMEALEESPSKIWTFDDENDGQKTSCKTPSAPIAEFYPSTTVMFADIAGFTAWSSQREPTQVFHLLETIYTAFDEKARESGVFSVENVGDCYIAAAGLPDPDPNHHITMARFAEQCVQTMENVVEDLVPILGADTGDLHVRVGLHSGPVTAGVIRGQKPHFQLFGDTVNTASRMESSSVRGKIQLSLQTAELLIRSGNSTWLQPREEKVVAKGKGELTTYWLLSTRDATVQDCLGNQLLVTDLNASEQDWSTRKSPSDIISPRKSPRRSRTFVMSPLSPTSLTYSSTQTRSSPTTPRRKSPRKQLFALSPGEPESMSSQGINFLDDESRQIDKISEILFSYLEAVMMYRHKGKSRPDMEVNHATETGDLDTPVELFTDVIFLPEYEPFKERYQVPTANDLFKAATQLRNYISDIASMYNGIPFHNFEHATRSSIAIDKLIQKITRSQFLSEIELYERSFGISSDPLTQFAILFAALVHDVGHIGISNSELVKENQTALPIENRSLMEQSSIRISWQLLLQPRFQHLRSCIYKTNAERKRFRQVVINSVLATDTSENSNRMKRWERAFRPGDDNDNSKHQSHRLHHKATLVIESVIQMADVSYRLQHWQRYRRWNDLRFQEDWATSQGTYGCSFDPIESWYKQELDIFDTVTIPLVKGMHRTGVLGEEGAVFVKNAEENRDRWEKNGEEIMRGLVEKLSLPRFLEDVGEEQSSLDSIHKKVPFRNNTNRRSEIEGGSKALSALIKKFGIPTLHAASDEDVPFSEDAECPSDPSVSSFRAFI